MEIEKYKRLIGYLKRYRLQMAAAVGCAILVSLLTAAYAYLVKPVLDDIFIEKNMRMLVLVPAAILVVATLKGLANYARAYLMRYVANRIIQDVRNQLYEHLLMMPVRFFAKHSTGKLMSRILNDVTLVHNVLSNVVKDLFQQFITMFFLIGVLFHLNWKMAVVAVLVLPFSYYPVRKISRRLRRISESGQEKMADLTTLLHETFTGIRVVKAFTAEGFESERFRAKNLEYTGKLMKAVRLSEMSPPLMEVVGAFGASLIILTGGYQVITGHMTPGAFFSFLAACWLMYAPIRHISTANNTMQQSLAAVDRVFALLDTATERDADEPHAALAPFRNEIRFDAVRFVYEGSEDAALENVRLTVKAGEVLALVGSSGAGKTTLVHLIPRFFDPTEGTISIDGTDIRKTTLSSLRRQIAIVSQETVLFDDTVAKNIAYGLKEAPVEAIRRAAEAANAHDFIRKLPKGYDTVLGERGLRLSGGQRQRIAIARAILKDAPILILDEATSNLDVESEGLIQTALARLFKGRTVFVIAHRLSTVLNADRIAVIEQGRIVEMGPHEKLIRQGGVYKRLYELQFQDHPRSAGMKP